MTEEGYAREFFKGDKLVELLGIQISSVDEKQAVIRAEIKPEHLNANGFVQGGMLYTVADFAFAVLSNYKHPATVTQGGQIQYLLPADTAYIKAVATETTRAGRNTVSEVVLYDDKERIVCVCHFNGFVKDVDRDAWHKAIEEKMTKED